MNRILLRNLIVAGGVIAIVLAVAVVRAGRVSPEAKEPTGMAPERTPTALPRALPRMVDLGADKCIPCKKMAPILAELKSEYAGRAVIDFIDVWRDPKAGEPYGVRVIPTQVFFDRDGKEVWRHEGFLAKDEIISKLKELGAT